MLFVATPTSSGGRRSVSQVNGAKDLGKGKHLAVPSVVPTKASGSCINQHHFADAKLAQVVAASDPQSIKAGLLTIIQRDGGQTWILRRGDRTPMHRSSVPANTSQSVKLVRRGRGKNSERRRSWGSLFGLSAARGTVGESRFALLERCSEHATETSLSGRQTTPINDTLMCYGAPV